MNPIVFSSVVAGLILVGLIEAYIDSRMEKTAAKRDAAAQAEPAASETIS